MPLENDSELSLRRRRLFQNLDSVELTLSKNINFQQVNPVKKTTKEIFCRILFTNWLPVLFVLPLSLCSYPFYYCVSFLFCLPKPPQLNSCHTLCCIRLWHVCFYERYARPFQLWERVTLFFCWLYEVLWYPIYGLMWNIDEIFFNFRDMDESIRPIILIQSARVGSTSFSSQLYELVKDEYIPVDILISFFPFLWMHKCLFPCCGCTRPRLHNFIKSLQSEEFHKRHVSLLDYPDTFEILYHMIKRGNVTTNWHTGFRQWIRTFAAGRSDKEELKCFTSYMKKAKYYWDRDGDKKVFLKCHSIEFGEHLAEMYPTAKFVNMVRNGSSVLESMTNFWLVSAPDPFFGGDVWVEHTQVCATLYVIVYREIEGEFYRQNTKSRRTFRFEDWLDDMEMVLKKALLFLDFEYHKIRQHRVEQLIHKAKHRPPRNYSVNFKLEDLWKDVELIGRFLETGLYAPGNLVNPLLEKQDEDTGAYSGSEATEISTETTEPSNVCHE